MNGNYYFAFVSVAGIEDDYGINHISNTGKLRVIRYSKRRSFSKVKHSRQKGGPKIMFINLRLLPGPLFRIIVIVYLSIVQSSYLLIQNISGYHGEAICPDWCGFQGYRQNYNERGHMEGIGAII